MGLVAEFIIPAVPRRPLSQKHRMREAVTPRVPRFQALFKTFLIGQDPQSQSLDAHVKGWSKDSFAEGSPTHKFPARVHSWRTDRGTPSRTSSPPPLPRNSRRIANRDRRWSS